MCAQLSTATVLFDSNYSSSSSFLHNPYHVCDSSSDYFLQQWISIASIPSRLLATYAELLKNICIRHHIEIETAKQSMSGISFKI